MAMTDDGRTVEVSQIWRCVPELSPYHPTWEGIVVTIENSIAEIHEIMRNGEVAIESRYFVIFRMTPEYGWTRLG